MNKEALQAVFFSRPHNVYDVAVYCYLLSCGGGRHRLCTRDMALLLGMSKRSLLDARRRLELEGLIAVVEKGHGQMGAVYEVVGLDGGDEVTGTADGGNGGHKMPETPDGKADEGGRAHLRSCESGDELQRSCETGDRAGREDCGGLEREAAEATAHRGELRVDDSLPDRLMNEEKEWAEQCCKKMAMTADEMKEKMARFVDLLICDGVRWKRRRDMKRHFNRWLRQENEENLKYRKNGTGTKGKNASTGKWRSKQEEREQQIRDRRAADYAMLLQASGKSGDGCGRGREGSDADIWGHL